MSPPLDIEVSELAAIQIRATDDWWRLNRSKAPLVHAHATLLFPVFGACIWREFVSISTIESSLNLSASRC